MAGRTVYFQDLPAPKTGLEKPYFSIREAGEKIRRLGIERGFEVVEEYPVRINGIGPLLKIDWVWLSHGKPVAGFEVEGADVPIKGSIIPDCAKLTELGVNFCFVVTYAARYKVGGWVVLEENKKLAEFFRGRKNIVRISIDCLDANLPDFG